MNVSLFRRVVLFLLLAGGIASPTGRAAEWSWRRTGDTVALLSDRTIVWQFNYGLHQDQPFFHPLSTVSGQVLSQDRPPDHVWNHGLCFCWKFINGVNYWEINPQTGKREGRTRWLEPRVETSDQHSAVVSMQLSYLRAKADGEAVLGERRQPDRRGHGEGWQGRRHHGRRGQRPAVRDRVRRGYGVRSRLHQPLLRHQC